MANSKLVIVEGPQGVGKTTITDFIRHTMKYTNLYRLSGTSDSTKAGLEKATKMYTDLQEYIKTLENLGNITGDNVSEDIINEIFSKFCLGK